MPLSRPDGLRTVGPQTLIQAEGQGRLPNSRSTETAPKCASSRTLNTRATGVTIVGDTALVLVERAKAAVVPYRPR